MAVLITAATCSGQQLADLISWVNGVFAFIYLAAMAAAVRLLPLSAKPLALLALGLCAIVVWTLGASMSYALVLVCVATPLVLWQQQRQRSHQPAVEGGV